MNNHLSEHKSGDKSELSAQHNIQQQPYQIQIQNEIEQKRIIRGYFDLSTIKNNYQIDKYLFVRNKYDIIWFCLEVIRNYHLFQDQEKLQEKIQAQKSQLADLRISVQFTDSKVSQYLQNILNHSKYSNYKISDKELSIGSKQLTSKIIKYQLFTSKDVLQLAKQKQNKKLFGLYQILPGLFITKRRYIFISNVLNQLKHQISRLDFISILFYALNHKYLYFRSRQIVLEIKLFASQKKDYNMFRNFIFNTYYIIKMCEKQILFNDLMQNSVKCQVLYANYHLNNVSDKQLFRKLNLYKEYFKKLQAYKPNFIITQQYIQMENWYILQQISKSQRKITNICSLFNKNAFSIVISSLIQIQRDSNFSEEQIRKKLGVIQKYLMCSDFSTSTLLNKYFYITKPQNKQEIITNLLYRFDVKDIHDLISVIQLADDAFYESAFILFINRQSQKELIINDVYSEQNILRTDSQILKYCNIKNAIFYNQLLSILTEHLHRTFKTKFERPYKKLINYINQKQNIQALATIDDYSLVAESQELKQMIIYIRQFFTNNILSYEYMMLQRKHQDRNNTVVPVQQFDLSFGFSFSIMQQRVTNRVYQYMKLKNDFARHMFISLLAQYIVFISSIDRDDKLLKQIEQIRSEHRNLIEENNALLNDYVKRNKITFKLSLIFTKQIIFFIENGNYTTLIQQISEQCNNPQQLKLILINLHKYVENFQKIMPYTDKFINYIYSNQNTKVEGSVEVILRSQFIGILQEKYELQSLYFKFIIFLLDQRILTQEEASSILSQQQFFQLKAKKITAKVNDNITTSIQTKLYTQNELAYFYGLMFQLKKQSLSDQESIFKVLNLKINVLTIKLSIKDVQNNLSKQKRQILMILDTPQEIVNYKVKEHLLNIINQPVIELFQTRNYIQNIVTSTLITLTRLDDHSMFFQIALDYQLLRDFQVAGVEQQIGFMYHYDCNLKDEGLGGDAQDVGWTGNQMNKTIRRLSVSQYRFFIIFYCSLILISSIVFGQYKGFKEQCYIISDYSTLKMDRINYLITQISNSFNVMQNYNGLTESGTLCLYEMFLEEFIIKKCNKAKIEPIQLENTIIDLDIDLTLQNYIKNLINQQKNAQNEKKTQIDVDKQVQSSETQLDEDKNNEISQQNKNSLVEMLKNKIFQQLDSVKQFISERCYDLQRRILNIRIFSQNTVQSTQKQTITIYQRTIPQITVLQQHFDNLLYKYAQQQPQKADFIRQYQYSLPKIFQLLVAALQLHDYIIKEFNGKLYWYEVQQQILFCSQLNNFIKIYTNTRQQMPDLGNGCAYNSFPEINEQICLAQLILTEYQQEDDEQVFSIINQVYRVYDFILDQINPKEEQINKQIQQIPTYQLINHLNIMANNFKTFITVLYGVQLQYEVSSQLMDSMFTYLFSSMERYNISQQLPFLKIKYVQTIPCSTYYQFISEYRKISKQLNINLIPSKFQQIFEKDDSFWNKLSCFSSEIICNDNTKCPTDIINMVLLNKIDRYKFASLSQVLQYIYGYEESEISECIQDISTNDLIIYASILFYKLKNNIKPVSNNQ